MLLAGTLYDPSTAGSFATTAAAAMTAIDTTNLRLTFTVPQNGIVAVKMRTICRGAAASPDGHLGILEGSTVKARIAGPFIRSSTGVTAFGQAEAAFVVPGLTPAASLTWDAAFGIETGVASSALHYGGPDNATANDARGGFAFEIWEATNVLGAVLYDPATAATGALTSAALAMTALDTTNLRVTFTTPGSGPGSSKVLVRCRAVNHGSASIPAGFIGILDGATVKARFPACIAANQGAPVATGFNPWDGSGIVAVTPNTTYNWDLAYGVELVQASTALKWGGPNDATIDNAFGAALVEVWKA